MASDEAEHAALSLQREVVIMKLIDHPNIMRLYDVWEAADEIHLILEYVQGGELFDHLCAKGRLPVSEALGYFQQIITAIDYCHRFNIAHRDLKPENILLDTNMNVKIADFGMAVWQSGNMLRTSCGSPHYAAPEVVNGLAYDGSAADVWSCGIILHALLVGKLPFDDDECQGVLEKIKIGVWEMPVDIPILAQDLLRKMITKDVKKRITIAGIKRHPFFLSQTPKPVDRLLPSLDDIARPISSREDVDVELFKSLQTLWHGTSEEFLIECLTNNKRNWQKGVYHLLAEYRRKSLEDYDEQEEINNCARLHRKKTKANKLTLSDPVSWDNNCLPPRNGPPTPRRASRGNRTSLSSAESSYNQIQSSPRETPLSPVIDLDAFPPLNIPQHEDDEVQAFFNQIADHLQVLHARTSGGSPNLHDILPFEENALRGLGISSGTKPLTVRGKTRPTIDTATNSNKENIEDEYLIVDFDSELKSSLKKEGKQGNRSIKRVHIVEPPKHGRSKLKKKRSGNDQSPALSLASSLSPNPVSPSSLTSPFSPLPSTPVGTWLASVFKFSPPTYQLVSKYDLHSTRSNCRRLLMEMNAFVMLEDEEGLGVLKCEIKDLSGIIVGLKSVKFRVEIHEARMQNEFDQGTYLLVMVQEKGSQETFKEVYRRLKAEWV